jgi:uncharacterized protein YqgC (DUF456 family)
MNGYIKSGLNLVALTFAVIFFIIAIAGFFVPLLPGIPFLIISFLLLIFVFTKKGVKRFLKKHGLPGKRFLK